MKKRANFRLDETLVKEGKEAAANDGRTFTSWIEKLIKQALKK